MSEITVYTTEPCAYCRQAKALLAKRGLEYEEINLAKDASGRAELAARTGMMTFPQIIVAGTLVGGFTELNAADQSGRLAELASA
jgi:glutaredoxin 3